LRGVEDLSRAFIAVIDGGTLQLSEGAQMSVQVAILVLWVVWYTTWIGAVVWSGRTRVQMRTDMGGLNRWLSAIGSALLFLLPPHHGGSHDLYATLTSRLWASSDGLDWTLFAVTVAAFAFCWWARVHLGRLWSGFVTLKEDHRIIDTGPYGLVRHPIYSGVIVAGLATALIRATPASLAGFLLFAAGFWMTARIEERFLRDHLGRSGYDDYSGRVGMLIPRVGGR
jgi:protein-S-isoprenylcysteine O-methyltransferase Ste14